MEGKVKPKNFALFLFALAFLIVGCVEAGSTPTLVATSISPTVTPVPPTATVILPTSTPQPTVTPVPPTATPEPTPATLQLKSAAFASEGAIPAQYACDGKNVSPPLQWSDPPQGAKSFALVVEDPDAKAVVGQIWFHWVLYNLPAKARSLPEAIPPEAKLADGSLHGRNSLGESRYYGPCPPKGRTHRYYFKLYALDTLLNLDAGASQDELLEAMRGHVLAEGQLMGKYTGQ
jgi:hypothetical protein